jgi:hypothetical protein
VAAGFGVTVENIVVVSPGPIIKGFAVITIFGNGLTVKIATADVAAAHAAVPLMTTL